MKISKLFHTLYAFLMFLPVMVLPLFAININQKEVEPLMAQIEETQVVDFNQLVNFELTRSYSVVNSYTIDVTNDTGTFIPFNVVLNNNEKYLYKAISSVVNFRTSSEGDLPYISQLTLNTGYENIITGTGSHSSIAIINEQVTSIGYSTLKFNLFNLTQMFGSGNEPTLEQFNAWYPNDFYQYTLSDKQMLHTGVLNTLNNTDVGSQFLYSLYNPLKDYFNLPNYMNLGGLYDWFLINLFSGYNSPVYFIIFDLMIYWLAMSLLWLIFDVMMYVPSMIHKMLDKARME